MARGTETKNKPEGKAKRKRHDQETRSKPKRRRHEPAESRDSSAISDLKAKKPPSASLELSAVGSSGPRNIAEWGDTTNSVTLPQNGNQRASLPLWRLSEPMGGRMSDIDPIFSLDEKHLLIVYDNSLQVYTTEDSLLVRKISFPMERQSKEGRHPYVVAAHLSQEFNDIVWVGCSNGLILRINWTSGSIEDFHTQKEDQLSAMAVFLIRMGKGSREILVTSESQPSQIVAYDVSKFPEPESVRLHGSNCKLQELWVDEEGRFLVGSADRTLIVGDLAGRELASFQDLKYQFYSFELSDEVSSLDLKVTTKKPTKKSRSSSSASGSLCLDLVVGCARGPVFVYGDIVSRLRGADGSSSNKGMAQPRKYHWHRRAVRTVKWSQDGNYVISGGSESVLVLWQLDTGKRDFLPHLGATIENVVVSPKGSSYAVHLDDNSTMVLSTAEMTPTSYISGLQSLGSLEKPPKGPRVQLSWAPASTVSKPLAAATNPAEPSRLFLGVGNGQMASLLDTSISTPLLQTFDISSFQSVSKQPLARTNPTDANQTSTGHPVTEPTVTHLCFSYDGKWLASIDEWEPPQRDIGNSTPGGVSTERWARERREVYLRFWEKNENSSQFELVTRVNEAHVNIHAERIFSVVADKKTHRFATLGNDGIVRVWRPKVRQRDGLTTTTEDGQSLVHWSSVMSVPLADSNALRSDVMPLESPGNGEGSGALCFSEDGSTLFAAFGNSNDGLLYIIDSTSGHIRSIVHDMVRGRVRSLQILSSHLIVLSDDLRVYDVVAEELQYGIRFPEFSRTETPIFHLSASTEAQAFAVSVSYSQSIKRAKTRTEATEIAIFSPTDSRPLYFGHVHGRILSLLPAVGSSGFLAVDSGAQVWTLLEATETTLLAQPLADLNLETVDGHETRDDQDGVILRADEADESEDEQEDDSTSIEVDEDDSAHEAVVAPQALTEIFDAAPAFAMPPIEEVFYQVAGLLSKPVATSA